MKIVRRVKAVIDVSVCVRWVVNEEYGAYAWRIRDDHLRGVVQVVMPSIGVAEVLEHYVST